MKVPKIAEEEAPVDPRISMKERLKTDKGDLANPLDNENRVFSQWTSHLPDFRFSDLFNYLMGKDPVHNSESLKSYILYWGTNYFLMDMWKNFGITHLNPIVIKVILSLL